MRHLAVWMALFSTLTGCVRRIGDERSKEAPAAEAYYPLAIGNRWVYAASLLGERREMTVEIMKQADGFFVDNQGSQLRVDGFGVRDARRYLIRAPVELGTSWTNVVSVSSVEHYRIVEVGQPCQVPAGTFDNCLRVEGRNRVDERTTLVNEWTFARGVGLVRVSTAAESVKGRIPQAELQLVRFEVGK